MFNTVGDSETERERVKENVFGYEYISILSQLYKNQ